MAAVDLQRRVQRQLSHRNDAETRSPYTPSTRRYRYSISSERLPHDNSMDMAGLAATRLTANAEALASFYETRAALRRAGARGRRGGHKG